MLKQEIAKENLKASEARVRDFKKANEVINLTIGRLETFRKSSMPYGFFKLTDKGSIWISTKH
jgi:hypothetical protein